MIAYGTRIRVLRTGATALVQDLEPGGLVYDPFADEHRVIEDILERRFTPEEIASDWFAAFHPLRIQPDALGPNMPAQALVISPRQRLMLRDDMSRAAHLPAQAELIDGHELRLRGKASRTTLGPATTHHSFALLFTQPVLIEANGALLQAYDMLEMGIPARGKPQTQAKTLKIVVNGN